MMIYCFENFTVHQLSPLFHLVFFIVFLLISGCLYTSVWLRGFFQDDYLCLLAFSPLRVTAGSEQESVIVSLQRLKSLKVLEAVGRNKCEDGKGNLSPLLFTFKHNVSIVCAVESLGMGEVTDIPATLECPFTLAADEGKHCLPLI